MWVKQISIVYITNKARINPRTIGGGNTRRFVGIEQAQIRCTLEVAENVFNTISLPACGLIAVSCQKIHSEGDVESSALSQVQ